MRCIERPSWGLLYTMQAHRVSTGGHGAWRAVSFCLPRRRGLASGHISCFPGMPGTGKAMARPPPSTTWPPQTVEMQHPQE